MGMHVKNLIISFGMKSNFRGLLIVICPNIVWSSKTVSNSMTFVV
jgi:hypothetical protein